MVKPREIKRKIQTVQGTQKITRTMDMVATVRSKQNQRRLQSALPYHRGLKAAVADVLHHCSAGHPLLRAREGADDTALVVVTSNRGLCGGYNAQVLRLAESVRDRLRRAGASVPLYVVGRKGVARFRVLGLPVAWSTTAFDDRPSAGEAGALADRLMASFSGGAVGEVLVIATRYLSAGHQRADVTRLLPIPTEAEAGEGGGFLFEGDVEDLLERLLPLVVRTELFRLLLEASASEQFARRLSMKAATENAEEMIKHYKRMYYRARQGAITMELMDVIGGANALSEGH